ncbi:YadA family autotransporter adhesin [Gallibacterium genomosp. 1]|uniref:Trimeric autotransporter adhesin YadA-like C-terminal membrane anchor domain-containing protein n=1 Tax=Gallibacterium genomosp. 1 TaxID=155515 RepID=A0A0A2YGT8_9PAST|nr:YadA-like family protein [Gallibacterium genomosp. 1]KGQ36559.1 hypothetical protein JP36_09655 [Gallibacterium genomosp. 1]
MLIKLDRSFFMYLPLMLSISFNVFARYESSDRELWGQKDGKGRRLTAELFECAPCERLNMIDKILGIDSASLVIDPKSEEIYDPSEDSYLKNTEWYRKFVYGIADDQYDPYYDPYIEEKREDFIKSNTRFGVIEKAIEANKTAIGENKTAIGENKAAISENKTAITNNTSAIDANKTAITNNTNTINTNRIAITNNTNAINANRTVIENHEDRIQQLESRKLNLDKQINQLHRDIKSLDDRLASGIAASNAMAGLVSATKDGKSMIAVGLGTYRDRSAIAIGISKLSNDGRWKAKFSFATGMNGSNKDLSTSTSIGYQF